MTPNGDSGTPMILSTRAEVRHIDRQTTVFLYKCVLLDNQEFFVLIGVLTYFFSSIVEPDILLYTDEGLLLKRICVESWDLLTWTKG